MIDTHKKNGIVVVGSAVLEGDSVALHVREVLLCLLARAGPQTLVVLDLPGVGTFGRALPLLKLGQREKRNRPRTL